MTLIGGRTRGTPLLDNDTWALTDFNVEGQDFAFQGCLGYQAMDTVSKPFQSTQTTIRILTINLSDDIPAI